MNDSISYCTVVMNRLHHLKETLPVNIQNNLNNPNVEFIILDYNSKDGLKEWITTELKEYLDSGIVKFFRTTERDYFTRSHSRNMAFKQATKELVCNIDADNYISKGFTEYVFEVFKNNPNSLILADTKAIYYDIRDAYGRFVSTRNDFYNVNGYDENIVGYGHEDLDLFERLQKLGRDVDVIMNIDYLKTITHGDEERVKNEYIYNYLRYCYISYIDHNFTDLLLLYKNGLFEKCRITKNDNNSWLPIKLHGKLESGKWSKNDNLISLDNGDVFVKTENWKRIYSKKGSNVFYLNSKRIFKYRLCLQYSVMLNEVIFISNSKNKDYRVNEDGFGNGKVLTY